MPTETDLLKQLLKYLDENHAERIVTIDVRNQTTIADTMIVATGRSSRHVKALAGKIMEEMKAKGMPAFGAHGINSQDSGDWVLVDFGECILHIMQADARSFYDIEGLWQEKLEDHRD